MTVDVDGIMALWENGRAAHEAGEDNVVTSALLINGIPSLCARVRELEAAISVDYAARKAEAASIEADRAAPARVGAARGVRVAVEARAAIGVPDSASVDLTELAIRLAAEGDAMRNIAVAAIVAPRRAAHTAALQAILAIPRACRSCGGTVEPVRQCYAVPTCYGCLPPPPALEVLRFCECGRLSVHEAGWCGISPCNGVTVACTGCVRIDGTVHGREHHGKAPR